jgi:hypothetical protein
VPASTAGAPPAGKRVLKTSSAELEPEAAPERIKEFYVVQMNVDTTPSMSINLDDFFINRVASACPVTLYSLRDIVTQRDLSKAMAEIFATKDNNLIITAPQELIDWKYQVHKSAKP